MTEVLVDVAVGEGLGNVTDDTARRAQQGLSAVAIGLDNAEQLEDGVQVLRKKLGCDC